MSDYEPTQGQRDRVVGDVLAYAASEGLSELGKIQAAVHFGMKAGVAAERERCARIAEGFDKGAVFPVLQMLDRQAHSIAAAIRADDAGREETR